MARDIEEFLRKAAERRRQQQQKNRRGPTPSQRVRELVETGQIEVVEAVEVEPQGKQTRLSRPIRDLRDQSISEHVDSHIDTSDISEHASHLGERIQNIDDRVAERLQRKFDHDVSRIDDLPTVQDDEVAKVTKDDVSLIAQDLVRMMRTPQNVRQAILLSEILQRPKFD